MRNKSVKWVWVAWLAVPRNKWVTVSMGGPWLKTGPCSQKRPLTWAVGHYGQKRLCWCWCDMSMWHAVMW